MDSAQYIYLLQEREFIKTKENIYKIGKTTQLNHERFKCYPKGSKLLIQTICCNCHIFEKELIKLFKDKFIQRIDIGIEYFQGNYMDMILTIHQYMISNQPYSIINDDEIINDVTMSLLKEENEILKKENNVLNDKILDLKTDYENSISQLKERIFTTCKIILKKKYEKIDLNHL
jgi:hypothetical protein